MVRAGAPSSVLLNVGCGGSPTPGWVNIDNSPTVRLAAFPWLWPLLPPPSRSFAQRAHDFGVIWGTATRLPQKDGLADALYSSHMMEHLDRREAAVFLKEALRVLRPGGVLRLALPDLGRSVTDYLEHRDADRFVTEIFMGTVRPHTPAQWLRHIITGPRHHLWMYDGPSLVRLLTNAGFVSARVLAPGETMIPDAQALNLAEGGDSVFVEAIRP
jgi:predicted SAM-dependent methyltransferase